MAEHVASNYRGKCRGKMVCECGTVWHLAYRPSPGYGSQRTEAHRCDICGRIVALTIFGSGRISGPNVKQKPYGIPFPSMPPNPDNSAAPALSNAFIRAADIEAETPITMGAKDGQTCIAIKLNGSVPSFLRMEQCVFVWTADFRMAMKFFDRDSAEQAAEECDLDIAIMESRDIQPGEATRSGVSTSPGLVPDCSLSLPVEADGP